jgi:hypothetical protein
MGTFHVFWENIFENSPLHHPIVNGRYIPETSTLRNFRTFNKFVKNHKIIAKFPNSLESSEFVFEKNLKNFFNGIRIFQVF